MRRLLAVPNLSDGRRADVVAAIGAAFGAGGGASLLDVHSDVDHDRSVLTLAGRSGSLAGALAAGAAAAVEAIDVTANAGVHPRVGSLDVCPVVHLDADSRGAACAEALVAAHRIGTDLGVPVFLYGALAAGRTRAELRRGGLAALAARMASGEQRPDFGPSAPHPTAGVTLVGARPPLAAFNIVLAAGAGLDTAREAAMRVREGGGDGLPGVRAIGVELASRSRAQVSLNVEDPVAVPLAEVVAAVRRHAPVAEAEVIGLVPRAALERFPADVPIAGFDAARQVLEDAVGS